MWCYRGIPRIRRVWLGKYCRILMSIFDDKTSTLKGTLVKPPYLVLLIGPVAFVKYWLSYCEEALLLSFWETGNEWHFFSASFSSTNLNASCSGTVVLNINPFYTHIRTSHTSHTYAHTPYTHTHTMHTYTSIIYQHHTHPPPHTILINEFINLTVAHCYNLSSVQFLALTTAPSPLVPFSQESILECKGVRILTVNMLSTVRKK